MISTLCCNTSCADSYVGSTQRVRVITEGWCADNLYCVACDSDKLYAVPANTRVIDFKCPLCNESYQVKGQRRFQIDRIVDGAYSTMLRAVQQNFAPNLLLLNYSVDWFVENLLLVPSLFFTESVLEKRKALGPHARRAGWIGCNLLLSNVPEDGRIGMVRHREVVSPKAVRDHFRSARKLTSLRWERRGWTTDVLKIIRENWVAEFSIADMYSFERALGNLHPGNRNVRAKIRQQLQVLRDLGFIRFEGGGRYKVVIQNLTT